MSVDLKDRAQRWFTEMWANRDLGLIHAWMAEDVRGTSAGGEIHSRENWIRAVFEPFAGAFPDLSLRVIDTVAQGSQVAVRWRFNGTHRGDQLGVPASGHRVTFEGISWLSFRDGQIVEGFDGFDSSGLILSLSTGRSHGSVHVD